MKNIFVTKEIAQKLKSLGFDKPCMAFYYQYEGFDKLNVSSYEVDENKSVLENTVLTCNYNNAENKISAPTWEQAKEWLIKKGFRGYVEQKIAGDFGFVIYIVNKAENSAGKPWNRVSHFTKHFRDYASARENLILELINQIKNKE